MLDIHNLMEDLSQHRPIFHSEADFQHALAWQIHKVMPNCEIRLEMPYRVPQGNWYLDIWLLTPRIAIELKYRTKKWKEKKTVNIFYLLITADILKGGTTSLKTFKDLNGW